MNSPSEEQKIIIDYVKNKNNVIVDACAGSGKSTTILSMAKQLNRRKFLRKNISISDRNFDCCLGIQLMNE